MKHVDEEQARRELENILDQREYQVYYEDNRSTLQILWDRARDWIADWLGDLFLNINPSTGMANGILVLLICMAALLLAVAAYRLIRTTERNRRFRAEQPFQSVDQKDWSFADHLAEADRQEGAGAYKPAVRHSFLALLLYFDEKNWLEARMWKTNGEYYEELRNVSPEIAGQFVKLAVIFDQAAYGDKLVTEPEYRSFRQEVFDWIGQDGQNEAISRRE